MKFKSLTALFVLFVHLSALAADVQGIVSCPEMQKPVKPGNSCCCGIEEAPDESRAGIPEFTRSKCNTSQSQDVNAIIYFGNERKEEQKKTMRASDQCHDTSKCQASFFEPASRISFFGNRQTLKHRTHHTLII